MQPTMRIDDEIRARTEAFAADLVAVIRRAALDAVDAALADPIRKGLAASRHIAIPQRATEQVRRARRTFGAKRPPAELASVVETLAAHIKAHPGQRMEHISEALDAPSSELNLPMRKLLLAKRVRAAGHKRATEYFPV
jgi:hypothetical protein